MHIVVLLSDSGLHIFKTKKYQKSKDNPAQVKGLITILYLFKSINGILTEYVPNEQPMEIAQLQRQRYFRMPDDAKGELLIHHRDTPDMFSNGFLQFQLGQDGYLTFCSTRKKGCDDMTIRVLKKKEYHAYAVLPGSMLGSHLGILWIIILAHHHYQNCRINLVNILSIH